jgi:hypothetical protein
VKVVDSDMNVPSHTFIFTLTRCALIRFIHSIVISSTVWVNMRTSRGGGRKCVTAAGSHYVTSEAEADVVYVVYGHAHEGYAYIDHALSWVGVAKRILDKRCNHLREKRVSRVGMAGRG